MQVTVFHPGTQHSWQTALALQQLGRLESYRTSIFYQPDKLPYRLERWLPAPLAARAAAEFRRFSHPGLDPALVHTVGLAEWAERIAARAGLRGLAQRIDRFGNRQFVRHLAGAIRSDRPFALWGYNGSSLSSFELGRAAGRPLILDRTIGDFRRYNRLMEQVAQSHAAWFIPADRAMPHSQIESDQREYELADTIMTGSAFCADSVRAEAGSAVAAKVRVLPYCFDEALFAAVPPPRRLDPAAPLRFLFIGQINPRKGVHHLLEAMARIPANAASLTMVGEMRVPRRTFAPYAGRVRYIPTVARADIPAIMAAHDVLVFPSYFEGSALSLIEALASGMGIIQTRASGNGATPATGLMLEEPGTAGLYEAMMRAVDDRPLVERWRGAAQAEAQNYTFARYRQGIADLLAEMQL